MIVVMTVRSIINPGIGVDIGRISSIKWIILFALSCYIIIRNRFPLDKQLARFLFLFSSFCVYLVISSFITGSYPIISLFKVISWAVVFYAVFVALHYKDEEKWVSFLFNIFSLLIFASLFLIPLPVGYLRNGRGFQGLSNHPNMFGILLALYFGISISKKKLNKWGRMIVLSVCFFCAVLTQSRASVFSIFLILVVYLLSCKLVLVDKVMALVAAGIVFGGIILVLFINDPMRSGPVFSFLYKGHRDSLLYTRDSQIELSWNYFKAHPLLGCGFMTPYDPEIRSLSFSFDNHIEPGNILLFLLGNTGLVGLTLFLVFFGFLFSHVPIKNRLLFLIPFILSLAEMTFFSSNNIAPFYYILLSITFKKRELLDNQELNNC